MVDGDWNQIVASGEGLKSDQILDLFLKAELTVFTSR